MPTDRPDAAELLEAVRRFLLDQAAPKLDGQLAFHARVAANALGIVARTLAEGDAMDEAERSRLRDLLQRDGSLAELNADLVDRIRAGDMDMRRAELLAHLQTTARDKVRLANPRYLTPKD